MANIHVDVSGWSTRLSEALVAEHSASGKWTNVTLRDLAESRAKEKAGFTWLIDAEVRITFEEGLEKSLRLATALRDRGLKVGDVVSFQLPNWYETGIINLACAIAGFICNPIVPIYRDAEVGYILSDARAKVIFLPDSFRGFDYRAMCERLRGALPHLKHMVFVRASADVDASYEDWLSAQPAPMESFAKPNANAVKLLLYTSGTTGHPKGVLHTHNTLRADIDATAQSWEVNNTDVVLMPSPVTHITGYLYALELPWTTGIPAVLMDRWNAADATALIDRHSASIGVGATPFLVELVSEAERLERVLPSLRMFASGGAPVPPSVIRRANSVLPNCRTFRAYGSSEAPTVTLGPRLEDPVELGATTDGFIVNHEVHVVDLLTGEQVLDGHEGEILTRGPEVMVGYTKPEDTLDAFDAQGFFRTGDLGVRSLGFLTITGRKKDLIIRGGENLSAKEIEDAIHLHPSVLEVAVVAMPHARMGETPCAYVVLKPAQILSLDDAREFLRSARLAPQKWPERLFIVDQLPRNAAGKVLKENLRQRVKAALGTTA